MDLVEHGRKAKLLVEGRDDDRQGDLWRRTGPTRRVERQRQGPEMLGIVGRAEQELLGACGRDVWDDCEEKAVQEEKAWCGEREDEESGLGRGHGRDLAAEGRKLRREKAPDRILRHGDREARRVREVGAGLLWRRAGGSGRRK